jgi:gamma-glutamyl-gamma-aminobutyrate hydrolase PuuD
MAKRPPLIAINGLFEPGPPAKLVLATRYADAVRRAGGLPLVIAPLAADDAEGLSQLLERVEGLLFSGGDDFATERLGLGPTHAHATPTPTAKQDFDFALARAALERGVPTLGICYGMQLLGLAEGGALFQHLPEDRPGSQEHAGGAIHAVRSARGSRLGALLQAEELDVVSRHHQALSKVGRPWSVVATDAQGLIEAIERAGHPFALGVQWHPELSAPDSPHARLFRGLVEAARARQESR